MAEQKKAGYPPIERVIGTIASVTTVAILFATQRQQLSFPAQVAVVSVLGILIILLFVWIWYRPIASYWTERRSVGTEDKISRESLDTFQSNLSAIEFEEPSGFYLDSRLQPLVVLCAKSLRPVFTALGSGRGEWVYLHLGGQQL